MFNLSKKLEERAQEVAVEMEAHNLSEKELVLRTFSGFLVKDGTEELLKRTDSGESEILGSITSVSNIKYWITLK